MKKLHAQIEVLTQDEIELIHRSSLKILEHTGAKVPNDECLDICERLGAKVDRNSCNVKIPACLMEEILNKVRSEAGEKKLSDECQRITGNISTQVFIVDYINGTRRYGTMDDVMKGIALVERLDNIAKANAVVVPKDVPGNLSDILTYQKIYSYSTKPGGTYILSSKSADYIIHMSKVMDKKVHYLVDTISPLSFGKETLEIALKFAKEAQPLAMTPMVVAGTTGPVTLAGMLTLQNAEVLLSLFMIYALTHEFTTYVVGGHTSDLRTMICSFGSPNQGLIGIGTAQMARFYGLPSGSNSGLTDSIIPDFQCGFEKAYSAMLSCLSGTSAIGGQGIAGADQGISLEQLVIDNEWLDAYNYVLRGIEVNEETIALDVIESVGIAGNFVSEEHTVEYMRENYWPSKLFNRNLWDVETASGYKADALMQKAHDFVQACTLNYGERLPVIEASKAEELEYIVKTAEKELKG